MVAVQRTQLRMDEPDVFYLKFEFPRSYMNYWPLKTIGSCQLAFCCCGEVQRGRATDAVWGITGTVTLTGCAWRSQILFETPCTTRAAAYNSVQLRVLAVHC